MTVPSLLNFVAMTVASAPGTGTITFGVLATSAGLGGGILPMSAVAVNGMPYRYLITDGNNRELAWGVYNSTAGTITRNTTIATVDGTVQTTPITATANAIISGIAAAEDMVTPASMNGGMINKFRNPGFDIAQRGTSGTTASGVNNYTLDGWIASPTGATLSWSQQYCQNMAGNAIRLSAATGMTAMYLAQRIESYLAIAMLTAANALQPITVQFAIYNGTSAAITPQLWSYYPTARDNYTSQTADLANTNLQTIAANSLGVVVYTFTPAKLSNGYNVGLYFGAALNASSGYIDVGQADIRVAAPAVKAGLNAYAPPPELRPINIEMPLNQRYFFGFVPGAANELLGTAVPLGLSNSLGISDTLGINNGLSINNTLGISNSLGVDNTISLNVNDLELETTTQGGGCEPEFSFVGGYQSGSGNDSPPYPIPSQPLSGGVSLSGSVGLNGGVGLQGSVGLTGSVALSGGVDLNTGRITLRLPVRMRAAPTGITVSGFTMATLSMTFASVDGVAMSSTAIGDVYSTGASDFLYVNGAEL